MASDVSSPPSQPRKIVHLPTVDTYNRWAATYDSDGNILQALDSYSLTHSMFQFLLRNLRSNDARNAPSDDALYITDFGCGTGRATLLLLATLQDDNCAIAKDVAAKGYSTAHLTGLDGSSGMLQVASGRIPASTSFGNDLNLSTQLFEMDFLDKNAIPKPIGRSSDRDGSVAAATSAPEPAHAVISTLVLEHLPTDIYFDRARALLRPGGVFLVTNMHHKMGTSVFSPTADAGQAGKGPIPTGAGFNDAATNTKIRAEMDFAHTIDEVLEAAKKAGFTLVDNRVDELSVESWMFEQGSSGRAYGNSNEPLLGPRGTKWIGTPCWYGMVFRLDG